MTPRSALLLVVAPLALALGGCGGSDASPAAATVPVRGKVLYKGKPLTSGRVRFEPDAGREAHGDIGPDGTFVLGTFAPGDGAMPGTCRVAVTGAVPPRYRGYASSGVEVTVEPGKADYTIDLP